MRAISLNFLKVFLIITIASDVVFCDYWDIRNKFINNEESRAIGSRIKLTPKESAVNKILMQAKKQELKFGFQYPQTFPPSRHFFQSNHLIEKSPVFKMLRKMPKGGALHVHDTSLSPNSYVLKNITYRDHLYACVTTNQKLKLKFADPKPDGDCWKSVKSMRESAKSVKEFDAWLQSKFNIITDNPYKTYPDVNTVWKAFINLFEIITPMITYRPVWEDYFYHSLQIFREDNVNYMEIRGTLPTVYELNGTTYNPVEVMGILKATSDRFLRDYPDFIGIKYIYGPSRACNNETMHKYIIYLKEMKQKYPDFVAGFDLVGQEDKGQPLSSFINQLTSLENIKFFFHAGETKWNGMSTDLNLVDAVLLNATRIGHGYALVKHPSVLEVIKQRGIGIEINPISNQVLNLVKDLRNHPANILFALDFPVVISSDDSGFWGARPLSSDFYEAFMGLANADSDIRLLKQLAYNSFLFSSLTSKEKEVALQKFNDKWDAFIDDLLLYNSEPFSVQYVYK